MEERVLERQCDPEYVEQLRNDYDQYDAVLSMACGVGPQFLSEAYPSQRFFPAVNTRFMGGATQHGVWEERCAGCGACKIHLFDGLCPIARCSKSLLHGPCGGSASGKCEVSAEIECIWTRSCARRWKTVAWPICGSFVRPRIGAHPGTVVPGAASGRNW